MNKISIKSGRMHPARRQPAGEGVNAPMRRSTRIKWSEPQHECLTPLWLAYIIPSLSSIAQFGRAGGC